MRKPVVAFALFGSSALALALAGPRDARSQAEDEAPCVCPVYPDERELEHSGTDDPALDAEQNEGGEPDDFEFEAPPSGAFQQEQTDGNEPDDFEFERD